MVGVLETKLMPSKVPKSERGLFNVLAKTFFGEDLLKEDLEATWTRRGSYAKT